MGLFAQVHDDDYTDMIASLEAENKKMRAELDRITAERDEWKRKCDAAVDSRLIAKMTNCPKGWQGFRDTQYMCPNCKKAVRNGESFCHKCGQAIIFPEKVYDKESGKYSLDFGRGAEREEA